MGVGVSRSVQVALALALWCNAGCTRSNPAFKGVARAGGDEAGAGQEPAPVADARAADMRPVADVASPDLERAGPDAAPPDAAAVLPDVAALPPDSAVLLPDVAAALPDGPADLSASGGDVPGDGPGPIFHYDFESGTDGWKDIRFVHYAVAETPVTSSSAVAHRGARSLAMSLTTRNQSVHPTFGVDARPIKDQLRAGARIEQWVWFPAGARLVGVQGFVYCYRLGEAQPRWAGQQTPLWALTPGAW